MENQIFQAKITISAEENKINDILENIKYSNVDKIDYYIEKPLTPRETEILKLIIMSKNNKEISKELKISLNTVKAHVKSIFRKLGVTDRVQAAVKAIKESLV